jgi:hypothetical protein
MTENIDSNNMFNHSQNHSFRQKKKGLAARSYFGKSVLAPNRNGIKNGAKNRKKIVNPAIKEQLILYSVFIAPPIFLLFL